MCLLSQTLLARNGTASVVGCDDLVRGRRFVKAYLLEIKKRNLNTNLDHLETYFKSDGISLESAKFVQNVCRVEVERVLGGCTLDALTSDGEKIRVHTALCIKAAVDFYMYGVKGYLDVMVSYGVLDVEKAKELAELYLLA